MLRRGERPDADVQVAHLAAAAPALAKVAEDNDVVIVHGNGPQVGLLALESFADTSLSKPYPLSDLVAETLHRGRRQRNLGRRRSILRRGTIFEEELGRVPVGMNGTGDIHGRKAKRGTGERGRPRTRAERSVAERRHTTSSCRRHCNIRSG